MKSASSQAIELLRKKITNFDFYEFEHQVKYIFKSVLNSFYNDDTERLELLTSETALGMLTGIIKQRKERKVQLKFKELIYLDEARYHDSTINDEDDIRLQFIINAQEINCLVNIEDGLVVEGNPSLVESCHYVFEVMLNPEPVVDLVGHPWVITKVQRTGVVQQLI